LVQQEESIAMLILKLAELLARDAGHGIHKAHVAAELGVLESAVHKAEFATVVVGIDVLAEGGAAIVSDKNIKLITVVDGFIEVTELTTFACVYPSINFSFHVSVKT
jgi:hypothetical protein